jgi:hypothetical protein
MQLETRTSGTKTKHTRRSPATARADQVATATAERPLGPTFRRPKQCVPRHAVASRVCSRRLGTSARLSREKLPANFTEPCGRSTSDGFRHQFPSRSRLSALRNPEHARCGTRCTLVCRAGATPIKPFHAPHEISPSPLEGEGPGGEGAAHVDVRCKLIRAAALLAVG